MEAVTSDNVLGKKKASATYRTQGSRGHWHSFACMSGVESSLNQCENLKRVDHVTIGNLLYPKRIETVNKTIVFTFGDDTMRASEDFEKDAMLRSLHPAYSNWAGQFHARIGGIDTRHRYTLWLAKHQTQRYIGRTTLLIVHAESTPLTLDPDTMQEMFETHPKLCRFKPKYDVIKKVIDSFNQTGAGPSAVDNLVAEGYTWESVVKAIPYFRMIRSPLLFRLWPQKQLMAMDYEDFCKLSDAVEDGTSRPLCFGFTWLMPCANVDELSLAHIKSMQFALKGVDNEDQILVEFFGNALAAAKRSGHTFSSLEELAKLYAGIRAFGAPPVFNFNTICSLPANQPYNVANLTETMSKMLPRAIATKVIKIVYHPKCPKAIYATDDYIKQKYVVSFINNLTQVRWDPRVHADGCKDVNEVFAKIASKKPSMYANAPGAPRWDNEKFQTNFKTLDLEQRLAVARAVIHPVTIVFGPPGAGKTTTGKTLFYLFGASNGVVPLAPYGRIAAMWRKLLENSGYTFHRAAGIVKYMGATPEAQRLRRSSTLLLDEYGLQTHNHLYMATHEFGHMTRRIVLFGDPDQMGAIGSGSFGKALHRIFKDSEFATHLSLPHRFALKGSLPFSSKDFVWTKPHVNDSMAIAWNMRQIVNYGRPGRTLDLVYTTNLSDQSAKFFLAPRLFSRTEGTKDLDGLAKTLRPIFEALVGKDLLGTGEPCVRKLNELGIQVLIQRNLDRKAINNVVFQLAYGTHTEKSNNSFYVGERVTFSRNAYFEKNPSGGVEVMGTDREIEHVNVLETPTEDTPDGGLQGPQGGQHAVRMMTLDGELGLINDATNGNAETKRGAKRAREDDEEDDSEDNFNGGKSNDVFNGEIRQLVRVIDIDVDGNIIESYDNTGGRPHYVRAKKKRTCIRMLQFTDDKGQRRLLNMSEHYDYDDMERANCLTAAKMQGSEDSICIYIVTPSQYSSYGGVINTLHNEELYTVTTRGKKKVIIVAGRDEKEALIELGNIASSREEVTRNLLAEQLNLDHLREPLVSEEEEKVLIKKGDPMEVDS